MLGCSLSVILSSGNTMKDLLKSGSSYQFCISQMDQLFTSHTTVGTTMWCPRLRAYRCMRCIQNYGEPNVLLMIELGTRAVVDLFATCRYECVARTGVGPNPD